MVVDKFDEFTLDCIDCLLVAMCEEGQANHHPKVEKGDLREEVYPQSS